MNITVIAVGKKHEQWVKEGIERYEKRLKAPYRIEWVLLAHSRYDGDKARQEESERLLGRIKSDDHVFLLDERGVMYDSPALSGLFEDSLNQARSIVIIIGGAYGVDRRVSQRADVIWSLSDLVFPHQLVRLILVEQIYRAQEISRGGQYHHV